MRDLAKNAVALAGLGVMSWGLWQLSPPWCCVIVGGLVFLAGTIASLKK